MVETPLCPYCGAEMCLRVHDYMSYHNVRVVLTENITEEEIKRLIDKEYSRLAKMTENYNKILWCCNECSYCYRGSRNLMEDLIKNV